MHRPNLWAALAVIFALVFLAVPAGGRQMDEFDFYCADFRLLAAEGLRERVQEELVITEGQRTAMNEHSTWLAGEQQKLQEEFGGRQPQSEAEAQQLQAQVQERMDGILEEMKRRVLGVLAPTQLKRLRQISLQAAGYAALADPTVSKKIGLADSQIETIQRAFETLQRGLAQVQQEASSEVAKQFEGRGEPKDETEARAWQEEAQKAMAAQGEKRQPKVDELTTAYREAVEGVLSTVQRRAFEELLGDPFEA